MRGGEIVWRDNVLVCVCVCVVERGVRGCGMTGVGAREDARLGCPDQHFKQRVREAHPSAATFHLAFLLPQGGIQQNNYSTDTEILFKYVFEGGGTVAHFA